MRAFEHFNASTLDEAIAILGRYGDRAQVIAGGTDLLGKLKDEILPRYPEALVNIKSISGMDYIHEDNGVLKIGALTRLEDIARHPAVRQRYGALAEAAGRAASPHLREMGTLSGNICQDIRCWYYRYPNNRFPCLRKGGGRCYAIEGANRYHSIFGGTVEDGCYAVHPSDTAPALIALDAVVRTTKQTLPVEYFFDVKVSGTTVLDPDEIVVEFEIPEPPGSANSHFMKFALRKTIDFAIVNCAAMILIQGHKVAAARVCLNAVAVKPYRAVQAEQAIIGQELSESTAEAAAGSAISEATPLKDNGYMVQLAKIIVKRTILACA
ncbi:MAG: FAD binding domain-containing protein [Anaerolineales bacterium]|jgi:xanthine dehydrogenase YagS FAD-binding subunit|nr:FAD binding domain-containing protein [Desulfobacteraceae bacterium]MCK4961014.1 FAD binding domain-containing protein [Anaerolineales bacterium]